MKEDEPDQEPEPQPESITLDVHSSRLGVTTTIKPEEEADGEERS